MKNDVSVLESYPQRLRRAFRPRRSPILPLLSGRKNTWPDRRKGLELQSNALPAAFRSVGTIPLVPCARLPRLWQLSGPKPGPYVPLRITGRATKTVRRACPSRLGKEPATG